MKDIQDVLEDFRESYASSYTRNQQCIDDIKFAFVPGEQWAGSDARQWANKPKPENNKLFKNIMGIVGRFQEAEFGARITPASDDATDDDAEMLQGLWRNDFNSAEGTDAVNNAAEEAFFGGFGAFKFTSKYDDDESPDNDRQYVGVDPINSAPSSVFFNVAALRKDKQDSNSAWHIQRVNRRATEEEYDVDLATFPAGNVGSDFDWSCGDNSKDTYIAHYYEKVERTEVDYIFDGGYTITRVGRKYTDQNGNKIDSEDFKAIKDLNSYTEQSRKVKCVEYALMSGDKWLVKPQKTPFKTIPIIPIYGYHRVINGIEFYCGEVARQRDPQRFGNMLFGSFMEIAAQPQTEKLEYAPEQVERHKESRSRLNIDNPAYVLSDPILDANDNPVHWGPVGKLSPPQIGTGLASALQFTNTIMAEQSGQGQATLPSNTAASAVQMVNERTDDSLLPLFSNAAGSIRSACKVWLDAAQKLYFSNSRRVRIMREDGSYTNAETLEYAEDENGVYSPSKNTGRGRYDITVRQGESYRTKRDSERTAAMELLQYTGTDTPMGQMAVMAAIQATTGEGMQDVRTMARVNQIRALVNNSMDLLMAGYDPKKLGLTSEEDIEIAKVVIQGVMQSQQSGNPQAKMMEMEGQARMMEGQAALMDKEIDMFNAETKRAEVSIKAEKAGIDAQKVMAETEGQQIKNASEFGSALRGTYQ